MTKPVESRLPSVHRPYDSPLVSEASQRVQRLVRLVGQLESDLTAIEACGRDFVKSSMVWEPFLQKLAVFDDRELYGRFVQTPAFSILRHRIRHCFLDYAHRRDLARSEAIAQKYLSGASVDRLSEDMTTFLHLEENELAKVLEGRSHEIDFLSVGCGASPETFLFYCRGRLAFRSFTALEIDSESSAVARNTVQRLGLGKVEVLNRDGRTFDYRTHQVIHIANYVIGKHEVLEAVASTARRGATVLVRSPKLLECLLCAPVEVEKLNGFRELTRIPCHYCQMDSVLLRMK